MAETSGSGQTNLGRSLGAARGAAGAAGRWLGATLHLTTGRRQQTGEAARPPGAAPGIEQYPEVDSPPPAGQVRYTILDYGPQQHAYTQPDDLEACLTSPRPDWATARWINVEGLHPFVINRFRKHFGFHTLAAEDVINVPQRPRVEAYDDHLFAVMRMFSLVDDALHAEQVSLFFFGDVIITFQERPGDVWDNVRRRIERPASRIRQEQAEYLFYALIDATVDHVFPLLESYGDALEPESVTWRWCLGGCVAGWGARPRRRRLIAP